MEPKENISQNPVDVSKLKNDNIPIITEAAAPVTKGFKFLVIFIYILI